MIRTIDRAGDIEVQKVTKPDGEFLRYQYGKPGEMMTQAKTLEEARLALGKVKQQPQRKSA